MTPYVVGIYKIKEAGTKILSRSPLRNALENLSEEEVGQSPRALLEVWE